jgi:putative transposase
VTGWAGTSPSGWHNHGRYSRRLRRTIAEIARLRARQARRRLDFTHKLTTDLAKSHGWVGIEDLRVREMTRSDNSPFERRRQLAYKTERYGSQLRLVRPAFTSQTCSTRRNLRPSGR